MRKIRKRDGNVVPFNEDKISEAIWKAAKAVGGTDPDRSKELGKLVVEAVFKDHYERYVPDVEEVQNSVEKIYITDLNGQNYLKL